MPAANAPKVKLKDTVNPFARIELAEAAKKKKPPAPPTKSWTARVGEYGKATAKKLWPSAFNP